MFVVLCLAAVFCCGGFLDGISGGGGLLTVPALLLADLPPELALGTNKASSVAGIASSLGTYARGGLVNRSLAVFGLPFALIGGLAGSKLVFFFPGETIGRILVFLLPLGILITLLPKKERGVRGEAEHSKIENAQAEDAQSVAFRPADTGETSFPRKAPKEAFQNQIAAGGRSVKLRACAICSLVGLYDGFFGPGSASFYMLGFHIFLGMGLVQAAATVKLYNLAASAGATVMFALHGHVRWSLVLPLSLAYIAGSVIGARLAVRTGAHFIRRVLCVSLSMLFVSLLWKFFPGVFFFPGSD
ncbi:MAG: TSUP family transporter [Desulfovibrio sp.]|nr:TSUP family transporter [Desulfovibrio sp.]